MVMIDTPTAPSSTFTDAVHAGREDFTERGVHAPPVDLSTTYPFTDLDRASASLDALAHGAQSAPDPVYARLHNPTVARWEAAIAKLERADEAVAFGSGMAAITAALLAAREHGSHVVALRPIYGTTDLLLDSNLLGFDVTWAPPETIADAIRPETALVLLETPANPTLRLVDIEAAVEQAGSVPVLVDSTFAPPTIQRPLDHGAALSLHSATKFLGGHGDVIAGVVSTNTAWAERLRQVRVMTGGLLHPWAAYLLHRSLPTLPTRVDRAQSTADNLAQRLSEHPKVARVYYPGQAKGPSAALRDRQMRGAGTMVSFDVHGGYEAAARVVTGVELITPAVSLGSVDTLIQHPAGLTHHGVDPDTRAASGVSERLIRLSVGLEEADALWRDLSAALEQA